MPYVDAYISVTDAKNRLLELIRQLAQQDRVVAVTRDGIPAAVLMSMRRFEELAETLDILSDHKAMASIRRSLKQAAHGRWMRHKDVFARKEA